MARNGSGTYNLATGNPVSTGTTISSTWANNTLSDIASALTQSVSKDGQTTLTGNLPAGNNKLTGLSAGSTDGDSLRFEQLFSQGVLTDVASAATVDIGAQRTNFLHITGTTTITSFGTNYNGPKYLVFADAVVLTQSSTLVLPGAANITTAANDALVAVPISGGWQVVSYLRASGDVDAKSINGGQLAGFRNRIINGNFSINQRAVTGTVVLGAGVYGHDRWKGGASGCTYTYSTTNNVTTITITAGSLQQVIEGSNLDSGTHVLSWTGTAQGKIGAGSYAASGVTGSATGGTNLTIEFNTGTISKVQFEFGSTASVSFENRMGMELILCQRYTQIVFGGYGGPSTNLANNSAPVSIPIEMRAIPAIIWLNSVFINNFAAGAASTANVEKNGFRALKTAIATATDSGFIERFLAVAEL